MGKTYLGIILVLTLFSLPEGRASDADYYSESEESSDPECTAFKFFRNLDSGQANVVASPMGADWCASMIMEASTGDTRDQFADILKVKHLTNDAVRTRLSSKYGEVRKARDYNLTIDNCILANDDMDVDKGYIDNMNNSYYGTVKKVNFEKDSNGAAKGVNDWTEMVTKGMTLKVLNETTELYDGDKIDVANVVAYKGRWATGFDKENSYIDKFNNFDGTQSNVMYMKQTVPYKYYFNNDARCHIVEMSYESPTLCYIGIMPENSNDLEAVEKHLACNQLRYALQNAKMHMTTVSIPKFQMESMIGLDYIWQNMGAQKAYTTDAEMSKLGKNAMLTDSFQNVKMTCDEEGGPSIAGRTKNLPTVNLVFNHPFIFAVQNTWTGDCYMIGKVYRLPSFEDNGKDDDEEPDYY